MFFRQSWNKSLAYDRGYYMGGEFRKKGVQVALGPVVGPLGRMASGGRNWEGKDLLLKQFFSVCLTIGADVVLRICQ